MEHCSIVVLPRTKLFKTIPIDKIMRHQVEELDKPLLIGPFKELQ